MRSHEAKVAYCPPSDYYAQEPYRERCRSGQWLGDNRLYSRGDLVIRRGPDPRPPVVSLASRSAIADDLEELIPSTSDLTHWIVSAPPKPRCGTKDMVR